VGKASNKVIDVIITVAIQPIWCLNK
jgi:hypothetical protein